MWCFGRAFGACLKLVPRENLNAGHHVKCPLCRLILIEIDMWPQIVRKPKIPNFVKIPSAVLACGQT